MHAAPPGRGLQGIHDLFAAAAEARGHERPKRRPFVSCNQRLRKGQEAHQGALDARRRLERPGRHLQELGHRADRPGPRWRALP